MKRPIILLFTLLALMACTPSTQGQNNSSLSADSVLVKPQQITLLFVGDLMQHQGQIDAASAAAGGTGYDYSDCFSQVKTRISAADVAIGNFEVTLGGEPYQGYPCFSAPDDYLNAIQKAGFDVLLTANNHCLDKGQSGFNRTIQVLDSLKMPHLGTYRNPQERKEKYPFLLEKNGFRLVFLNYTYGTNGLAAEAPSVVNYYNPTLIKADVAAARTLKPDAIIACMHWGDEYQLLPNEEEKELANLLFSEGVTHIIGGHPHVIQPLELRRDSLGGKHLLAYSLGNFISNMSAPNTDGGLMVEIKLTKKAPSAPTELADYSYHLVWCARPKISGKTNYQLFYAEKETPLNSDCEILRKKFTTTAKQLFKENNKGF